MAIMPTQYTGRPPAGAALKEKAGRLAKSVVEKQKARLAKQMDMLAAALAQTAGQLAEQEEGKQMSGYLRSIAGKMEQASVYLGNSGLEDLLEAAKRQIRDRPALVIGGALITGYILARLSGGIRRSA
jgi:hypothetical protein